MCLFVERFSTKIRLWSTYPVDNVGKSVNNLQKRVFGCV